MKPSPLCIDSDFVLMLMSGDETCVAAYTTLEGLNTVLNLTETPLQELQETAAAGATEDFKKLATISLRHLRDYGIKTPGLGGAGNGVAGELADYIIQKVNPELSKDAALALSEASLLGAKCFLTMDPEVLAIDSARLNAALIERDASTIAILTPESFQPPTPQRPDVRA